MANQIFRQESLQRLQSPEEFDQLLVVVDRKAWLILLTLAAICAGAATWSVVGRIPVRVDGIGVLVNPGNVKALQSPASGQITSVEVRVGQHVTKGDVIARLDQPELRKELEQLRAKREDTAAFHKTAVELDEQRRTLETAAFEKQRTFILDQVTKLGDLTVQLGDKSQGYIDEQRRNIEKTQRLTQQLNLSLGKQLETIRQLKLEGLSSQDLVLSAETNMADSEIRMANLDVQRQELNMQEIQRRQSQLDQENRRSDLALQLMQLDISAQRLIQELTQNRKNRENETSELDNAVSRLELRLERESRIVGKVRRVSSFPVTQESVVNDVGNAEIAQALLRQGGAIEVEVELERDPNSYSGFRWTSKDPEKKFSAGTTTTVRITIEQRAPITYLLPILRTWFMGAQDAQTPDL